MNSSAIPLAFDRRQLRRMTGLLFALWTLAVAASAVWNAHLLHETMFEAVTDDARNSFYKDVVYRRWAAMHGGVYVPVTALTPPNPYLTNIVERDLLTPSGRRLTLVNPAYMTRQVHELETDEWGTRGHITSLKPLRPENVPDAWEAAALRAFEQGRTEVVSSEPLHGKLHLRFMKPLITEAACLKCHAAQGYHVGDIRGGISVAVPIDHYLALEQAKTWRVAGVHVGLWALGALGIFLSGRQMRQCIEKQSRAEAALRRSETKFRTLYDSSSDAVMLLDTKGFFDCNPATLTIFGCASREDFCAQHPADFSPLVQPDGTDSLTLANQRIATAMKKGSHHFEWLHKRADTGEIFPADVLFSAMELDGKPVLQAVVRDITERRQMEDKLRQLSKAVEQSPASIVITDPAGNIEYANRKFTEVTGYTPAEALGKNPRILKSGEQSPEVYRELWQTITAGKEWHGEFHNKKKNGELYWEIASISPIRDLTGHITHYIAVKEDITEGKKAEAQREGLIKSLEAALARVKSLSGLLPICAGCKKIRDDKGYWNQVESYIQTHSEASFSHGMCPDCIKKFYPDFAEENGLGEPPKEAA
jgi:PAS domain S-box-containing protein